MKKTFREQLLPILEKRFRNNPSEVKRHLAEASTPAAQTLIKYIQQWKFRSRNVALGRLLECQRWNDKGELVLEPDFKGKEYPATIPLALAWDWYVYGDLNTQFVPSYSFAGHVKDIPDNAKKHWVEEIKELFGDINRQPLAAFKIVVLGTCVKSYGVGNPHTFSWWDRQVSEFQDAQKAIDAYVKDRKGWEYLTVANQQNPDHGKAMSAVLTDILAKADELVEPSAKAIAEMDRKLYIRQDATQARNNVKRLTQFFKKYATATPNALELVAGIINDVESQALNPQTKGAKPMKH